MIVNILDNFADIICAKKNEVAVEHNDEIITFGELNSYSNSIAASIKRITGCATNKPIAVFLPKGINAVIADIAVIISGNPFMNLDILTPSERVDNVIGNVNPLLIITDKEHAGYFSESNVLLIDDIDFYGKDICDGWHELIDTDPFCIINTSGSTGTPKSVVLNHRSFIDFIEWSLEVFGFDGNEVIGSLSPIVFDIFVFELCLLLTKGSRIVLMDSSLATFPVRLVEQLCKKKISYIFWVPTIMVNIANMDLLSDQIPKSLRLIWFAGEVFPTKQFLYWYDRLPSATFVNMYGPIEITLDCTYYKVTKRPKEDKPIPIGVPCRNTDILLLNKNNRRAKVGEEAELCVRGSSLAMGYYNNKEKTEEAFVQNPLNSTYPEIIYRTGDIVYQDYDGLMYIKGRKDSMIKHNGYRIELAEIEHVIVNRAKIVKNCCAVYDKKKKKIILYYENELEISRTDFRKSLSNLLPNYMLPNTYVFLQNLPKNTNGKIDRFKLQGSVNLQDEYDK